MPLTLDPNGITPGDFKWFSAPVEEIIQQSELIEDENPFDSPLFSIGMVECIIKFPDLMPVPKPGDKNQANSQIHNFLHVLNKEIPSQSLHFYFVTSKDGKSFKLCINRAGKEIIFDISQNLYNGNYHHILLRFNLAFNDSFSISINGQDFIDLKDPELDAIAKYWGTTKAETTLDIQNQYPEGFHFSKIIGLSMPKQRHYGNETDNNGLINFFRVWPFNSYFEDKLLENVIYRMNYGKDSYNIKKRTFEFDLYIDFRASTIIKNKGLLLSELKCPVFPTHVLRPSQKTLSESKFDLQDIFAIDFLLQIQPGLGSTVFLKLLDENNDGFIEIGFSKSRKRLPFSGLTSDIIEDRLSVRKNNESLQYVPLEIKDFRSAHYQYFLLNFCDIKEHGISLILLSEKSQTFDEILIPLKLDNFTITDIILNEPNGNLKGNIGNLRVLKKTAAFKEDNNYAIWDYTQDTSFEFITSLGEVDPGFEIAFSSSKPDIDSFFPENFLLDNASIFCGLHQSFYTYDSSAKKTIKIAKQISGDTSVPIESIGLIDLWIHPFQDSKKKEQCIFEISDGLEIGNFFGFFIQRENIEDNHFNLGFKRNRVDANGSLIEDVKLQSNTHSHVLISLKQKQFINQDSQNYKLFEVSIVINGTIATTELLEPKYIEAFDAVNDFYITYMSLGETLSKNNKENRTFEGKIIGPRFWETPSEFQLRDAWPAIPAYAFMYFKADAVFGAANYRNNAFGKLLGTVRELTYPEVSNQEEITKSEEALANYDDEDETALMPSIPKIIWKDKTDSIFYMYPDFGGVVNFFTTGTDMSQPKEKIWEIPGYLELDVKDDKGAIKEKGQLKTSFQLGQYQYPYPLKKKLVGYPNNLWFSDIQTFDFWIKPNALPVPKKGKKIVDLPLETILCFEGVPSVGYRISGFVVQLDPNTKSLVLRKVMSDGETSSVLVNYKNPAYYFPDLWNGRYHHICIQVGSEASDLRLQISVNGLQALYIGSPEYFNFDFKITSIYGASDPQGGTLYKGEMCGPRFWKGKAWDAHTTYRAAFTDYGLPNKNYPFKHSKELGRIYFQASQKEIDTYMAKGLLPESLFTTKGEEEGFGFQFSSKPLKIDMFHKFVGTWANLHSSYKIPLQEDLVRYGKEDTDHCIYQAPSFIYLDENSKTKKVAIFTDGGRMFEIGQHTKNSAQFIDDELPVKKTKKGLLKDNVVCEVKFMNEYIPHEVLKNTMGVPHYQRYIEIISYNTKKILSGTYSIPYRKPDWDNDTIGNIFLNRPGNFNTLLSGYDITQIDPLVLGNDGATGHPIFRIPPASSPWMDVWQGVAIPFGWNIVPFASFVDKTKAQLLINKQQIEEATSNTVSHSSQNKDSMSMGVSIPGVGSLGYNHSTSLNTKNNRKVALNVKKTLESESFSTMSQWFATSHDIVIDKANILFDGQYTGYDNSFQTDFKNGFYWDALKLRDADKNKKHYFLDFIKKYGTHYISSARFGSKGFKMHTFSKEVADKVAKKQIEFGSNVDTGKKSGLNVSATIPDSGGASVSGGGSNASGTGRGFGVTDSSIAEYLSSSKKDEEIEKFWGTFQEKSIDEMSAIHVYRHMLPIYTLFSPPFFNDPYLITIVREKLRFYTNKYIDYQRKHFPRPNFTKITRQIEITIQLDNSLIYPTLEDVKKYIPKEINGLHLEYDDPSIKKYERTVQLTIELFNEKKELSFLLNDSQNEADEQKIVLLKRERVPIKEDQVSDDILHADPPEIEILISTTTTLNVEIKNTYKGIIHPKNNAIDRAGNYIESEASKLISGDEHPLETTIQLPAIFNYSGFVALDESKISNIKNVEKIEEKYAGGDSSGSLQHILEHYFDRRIPRLMPDNEITRFLNFGIGNTIVYNSYLENARSEYKINQTEFNKPFKGLKGFTITLEETDLDLADFMEMG